MFYLFGLCLSSSCNPYSLYSLPTLGSPPKGMDDEGVDCIL